MRYHCTTHGVIVIIPFLVLGFIFSTIKMEQKFDSHRMLNYILRGVIISAVVTVGFYIADLDLAAAVKY
ncbi:MAG TPA: hypothetical protein VFG29_07900 [Syntrophales bacterium]|nr:hypothetical protein [Syntrophales bacterium]